jgi:hypothetical protein
VKGSDLKRIRERFDWSQTALAEHLNAALDRKYSSATISAWELDRKPIPAHASAFVEALAIDSALPPHEPSPGRVASPDDADTAPDPPHSSPGGQVPLSGSGAYDRVCTELWGIVAMLPASLGAFFGNAQLVEDGRIIDADKQALGQAWGKLAETNETFRRMLIGATTSGAWLEVGLVTGMTFGKVAENHMRNPNGTVHLHSAESQADGAVVA